RRRGEHDGHCRSGAGRLGGDVPVGAASAASFCPPIVVEQLAAEAAPTRACPRSSAASDGATTKSSRLPPLLQRGEPLAQRRQREAAVADAILQRWVELGSGTAVLRIKEHRVVAEAAIAARCAQDAAVPAGF